MVARVFILLPPSEAKTPPQSGAPLDLNRLHHPGLTHARTRVLEALINASAGGPDAIGAPPTLTEQVAANTRLWEAPTAPAAQVYTGVLYAAADLGELTGTARERCARHVRIASAAFGFVGPYDPIPAYRLPPAATLPGVGSPLGFLAAPAGAALEEHGPGLVLDCRSTTYLRLWRPACAWVHVKAIEVRGGKPVVVSHFAKHHQGVLVRHLLTRGAPMPATAEEVLEAARELVGSPYTRVELLP